MSAVDVLFAASVAYAVIGNALVLVLLRRRSVPLKFMWAGTPGYLYSRCVAAGQDVSRSLRRFALSTNVAWLVAMLCLPMFVMSAP